MRRKVENYEIIPGMTQDPRKLFDVLRKDLGEFVSVRSPVFLKQCLDRGFFLYGCGGYGRRVLALLRAQGFDCLGVIDRKFLNIGDVFEGLQTFHPDSFDNKRVGEAALIVGIHNPDPDFANIFAFAERSGFLNKLWNADLPDILGSEANNYWLTNRQFTVDNFDRFVAVAKLLADHESVELLAALIRYRTIGTVSDALKVDIANQYYPPGIMNFTNHMTFVDGGAFNGDTFSYLLGQKLDISTWVAFEPDPINFEQLVNAAKQFSTDKILYPCGLSDHFELLKFRMDQGTSSHLSASGAMTIPCVALDDVISNIKPDYIKLDIEGAELAALRGMAKTIEKNQPALAVAAYHKPDHLYRVIELVAELAVYSDIYLRQHGENAFETVVYAVPKNLA